MLPVQPASKCPGVDGSPSDISAGGEGGKDSCQVKADFILYAVRFLFVFFF